MPYSSLPFPSNIALENLKVIASDTVLYVSTTGNDSTGTGTLAAPFATLSKAMDVAREYVITGDAVLTVRLLKGEHTLTSNIDLYHPQGGNLIIEGDPAEFKQRTLYSVDSYTWNLANFAGGGHTANIRLFDGSTTGNGVTLHGFTAEDQGCYFCVSNGAFGSRSGYATNGYSGGYGIAAPGASSSYDPIFWGDRFFNHGFSHEDGMGILGIGRIQGATTHGETLSVQFNNLNWDCRCPAWHTNGGLANTVSWGGIASNYPETQYSQPVGYYGNSAWKNETGSKNYPSKPSSSVHISPDPYILSSYPVTLRARYSNNTGSLILKGGKIRAIRNLMFVNSEAPFTLITGVTGATMNWTQAITAVNTKDFNDPHSRFVSNGCALMLEDCEVGIRHLGFLGTGTAISAFRSKITKFTQNTSNASVAVPGITGNQIYATLNSLDNTPVLCVNQCQNGIIAKNCTVDFTDSSGVSRLYNTDYSDSSVLVSAGRLAVHMSNSEFSATSLHLEHHRSIPSFMLKVLVPAFAGTTVAGSSAAFNQYAGSTAMWQKYPLIKVMMHTTDGGNQEVGFVNFYAQENTQIVGVAGSTASATVSGDSATALQYQKLFFSGLKTMVNNGGISYMGDYQLRDGINAGVGGTLGIYFYSDLSGTTASAYILDRTSVRVVTQSGTTASVTGIPYNASNYASNFIQSYDGLGNENVSPSAFGKPFPVSVCFSIRDNSKVLIEKVLWINNAGDAHSVLSRQSSLIVGDAMVLSDPSQGQSEYEQSGTVGLDFRTGIIGNWTTGTVCLTGVAGYGAMSINNCSTFKAGVIFCKHPTMSFLANDTDNAASNSEGWQFNDVVLAVSLFSSATIAGMVSLGAMARQALYPTGSNNFGDGLYRSRTNRAYGAKSKFANLDAIAPITAQYTSNIHLHGNGRGVGSGVTLGYVFHPDGGNMLFHQQGSAAARTPLLFTRFNGYILVASGLLHDTTAATTANDKDMRFTSDKSAGQSQKISTRAAPFDGVSGGVYNTSTTRWWLGNVPGASAYAASTGQSNGMNSAWWSKTSDTVSLPTSGTIVSAIDQGGRIHLA